MRVVVQRGVLNLCRGRGVECVRVVCRGEYWCGVGVCVHVVVLVHAEGNVECWCVWGTRGGGWGGACVWLQRRVLVRGYVRACCSAEWSVGAWVCARVL